MTGPMFFSSYLGLRANVSFRTFCLDTNDFFFFFFFNFLHYLNRRYQTQTSVFCIYFKCCLWSRIIFRCSMSDRNAFGAYGLNSDDDLVIGNMC